MSYGKRPIVRNSRKGADSVKILEIYIGKPIISIKFCTDETLQNVTVQKWRILAQ